jgi:hypothetical protein
MHRPHPSEVLTSVKNRRFERHTKTPSVEDRFPDTLDRLIAENERRKRKLSRRLELLTSDELVCLRDGMVELERSLDTTEHGKDEARAMRADVEAELDLRDRAAVSVRAGAGTAAQPE